jgi:hypothetical protein
LTALSNSCAPSRYRLRRDVPDVPVDPVLNLRLERKDDAGDGHDEDDGGGADAGEQVEPEQERAESFHETDLE